MSGGPVCIVNEKDFRLVRVGSGDGIKYVLEVPDDCDALGVERWRACKMNSTAERALFGFLVRLATKGERDGDHRVGGE